ncbi:MFS transporter [Leptospira levettii]|uniref:MFS transporter n=1 Tax=Leptospira levettii TaxID=2023178 RepID=A0A6H3NCW7_9LEPT|nr:MFS transporter [Leptospira levettii]MCW7467082.1 MFS transporter [Leptospira levettii]MCW7497801.1 MFS transporter [Leptospira levettii]MCW7512804.1 MFS transporter [Leptospira levettii]MCW7516526.1 MFS transporter [Leptospira levettii]TGM75091.1 MFS transporter [Leptospira levettii]
MKPITKTVWILSLVSLFTDIASEMLYPILPIYLKSIGYSILFIGFLEGVAEFVAGYSKGYFGNLSDIQGKRVPFVRFGYALSAISKPLLAISRMPYLVFFSRTLDRIGKGVRTGARDALLSEETTASSKAQIFGFHRSFDTLGAVIGPSLALIFLAIYPNQYIYLFYLAVVPGFISIGLTFLLKEKENQTKQTGKTTSLFSYLSYWKQTNSNYRKLVFGLLVFALWNSSDVFLILKAKEVGLSDTIIIGIYIFYNLVYAVFAFPFGILADRMGLKRMFLFGISMFIFVYWIMGTYQTVGWIVFAFFLYGLFASATEGIGKAWISNLVPSEEVGTAIGMFTGLQSFATFFASVIAGWIWFTFGAGVTFLITGLFALLVWMYLYFIPIGER